LPEAASEHNSVKSATAIVSQHSFAIAGKDLFETLSSARDQAQWHPRDLLFFSKAFPHDFATNSTGKCPSPFACLAAAPIGRVGVSRSQIVAAAHLGYRVDQPRG
jgi:hypothetical protein